jgi:hypothetical protein
MSNLLLAGQVWPGYFRIYFGSHMSLLLDGLKKVGGRHCEERSDEAISL